jgi:His-Xaa-Ser system radical SAM maturase HxsC
VLLSLSNKIRPLMVSSSERFIVRVSEDPELDERDRAHTALLLGARVPLSAQPPGYRAYLFRSHGVATWPDSYVLPTELHYVAEGDVVRVDPERRHLHALYRKSSDSNFFLVTERCDNFCIMCSQPPREVNDDWLVDELQEVVPLIDKSTQCLGITGGEPGLLGERLTNLVRTLTHELPNTALHMLSNGRAFANARFARDFASVRHPDLMLGIPLYSDLAEEHDYVVQSSGAFDETVRGILNLKKYGVRVELRVVIHRDTIQRLPDLASFIARNLIFMDHVALMGLELTGFAKTNLDALWVDPVDYMPQLTEAVRRLQRARVPTSVYNHQLCVLPAELHPFARKSISDWKNGYAPECQDCARIEDCGGFFESGVTRRSRAIAPFMEAHQ